MTITAPSKSKPTNTQIFHVRSATGVKCTECKETVAKDEEAVRVEGGLAHWDCAGVEHKLDVCSDCFMIVSNCMCEF